MSKPKIPWEELIIRNFLKFAANPKVNGMFYLKTDPERSGMPFILTLWESEVEECNLDQLIENFMKRIPVCGHEHVYILETDDCWDTAALLQGAFSSLSKAKAEARRLPSADRETFDWEEVAPGFWEMKRSCFSITMVAIDDGMP